MERLTKKEEEIMHILWRLGKGLVRDVIDKMPPPKPPHSTISSVVRILEEKGFVGHKAYGKTYEYFPLISKDQYRKSYMKDIVRDYFANSYKDLVSFFAREEKISDDDLKDIIQMINKKEEKDGN